MDRRGEALVPEILHILETCIYARDLTAAERFYTDVLGLEKMTAEFPRHVFFRVSGQSVLLIFNPDETIKKQDIPAHGSHGPGHVAFAIAHQELDAWREHLGRCGVVIEAEVAWPNGAKSLYFRDPAENSVEIVTNEMWT